MSLIKLENKDSYIEMNDLEILSWTDGWNGGQWNNWDVINHYEDYRFFIVNSVITEIEVVVKDIYGNDSDMGHTYHWVSKRVYIKENTVCGEVLVNYLEVDRKNILMYCHKTDLSN